MYNRQDLLLEKKNELEMGKETGCAFVSNVCVVGFGRKLADEL